MWVITVHLIDSFDKEKSSFPQIWGISPDSKFEIPPELGDSPKAECSLTVKGPSRNIYELLSNLKNDDSSSKEESKTRLLIIVEKVLA